MRKKIAVLILNMYGAMVTDIQKGLNEAAFEEDVKLIYFASFSDGFSKEFYDQYVKYDEGDIVSFKLPNLDDFDGVIVVSCSFSPEYLKRIDKRVHDNIDDKFHELTPCCIRKKKG